MYAMKTAFSCALIILLAGCSQPQYLREANVRRAEGDALRDSTERMLHVFAQITYSRERGARPFEVVLAEEKQKYEERMQEVRDYTKEQSELQQKIRDGNAQIQEMLARMENEEQETRWKQEMLLRELKVGDRYPWKSEIGSANRTINRDDGSTVLIFELKETVGINTTVTVDKHGKVVDVTRYP
jgi:hypothetical protein